MNSFKIELIAIPNTKELYFTMKSKTYKSIILSVFIFSVITIIVLKQNGTDSVEKAEHVNKNDNLPRLLELGSHKCVPCKMMMPILDTLKQKYSEKLNIDFIDVWENREAGNQYNVKSIPTQIFFDKNGVELFRHIGFWSRKEIEAKFDELGIKLSGNI